MEIVKSILQSPQIRPPHKDQKQNPQGDAIPAKSRESMAGDIFQK